MEKIIFEDLPSTNTPINSTNLNQLQDNIENNINSLSLKFQTITNLSLGAGATYQLNLPQNTVFIEPLVMSSGNDYGGGVFVPIGGQFVYVINSDINISNATYAGIWVSCTWSGLVSISDFRHNGKTITGFRMWYFG